MRATLTAIVLSVVLFVALMLSAAAAPIDCPNGQTATKTGDWWACTTNSGNSSNAGDSSNPNGNPHFPR